MTSKELDEPFISSAEAPREITVKAVILGVVLAAVLAGANAYLGLKVGLTVSASIPAAVISMAVFRLLRGSTIVENNIVQTAASAGEALAAGVIFTLPALVLLGYWQGFPFLPVMAIALCGGVLGVLFTVPLRRALIVNANLAFPEGVATGEVLKAGERGGKEAKYVVISAIAAGILKLCQTGFGIAAGTLSGAASAGRAVFGFGSEMSVALLGVGYIVRVNIAGLVFTGGVIAWVVGIPLYMTFADPSVLAHTVDGATGYDAAEAVWSDQVRYLGVGAMAIGGVWALGSVLRPVVNSIRSSVRAVRAAKSGESSRLERTERDIPANFLLWGTIGMAVPIFLVFLFVVDRARLQISSGLFVGTIIFGVLFALIAGFLFSSVSGYMTGLVGSSNNPVSGVTILTLLVGALLLLAILGVEINFTGHELAATVGAATAVLMAAVVSCAAAIAGDNLHDLKAGRIVGATPWKQQTMLIVGVVVAAVCIAPILSVLYNAYGIGNSLPRQGMNPSEALQAPQATLMSSIGKGVFAGGLPWTMIGIGAGLAVLIIVLDRILVRRGARFRTPVLAVAVGLYLPIEQSVALFIGGLVAVFADRALRKDGADPKENRRGMLFASGLITGEALVGIILAIPFAAAQSADVLALSSSALGMSEGAFTVLTDVLGGAAFVCFIIWLFRVARRRSEQNSEHNQQ
ncbi:OPT family oligopeptide transporter [Sciscionella marina]|uniref:OPT family oligopeptide transporter n=1 Tax=Sciscionella marina TaxID=508770 RepID=UPI0003748546|nr:oligopeptide transporter, OPT family [Sciscionella marina]